jgi:hypothetical protein
MDTLRDLSSTLWTLRASQESARVLRTTQSLLRCFLFFDICYLVSGIALVTLALANQMEQRSQMVLFGGLFGLFASVSAACNFLASHGLRTWRRHLLLPWLSFFLLVLALLFLHLGQELWCHRLHWRHAFLFLATFLVLACWRHMQRQFLLMALPPPSAAMLADVEAVVREVLQPLPKDAPPRYEEVSRMVQGGEEPPRYDEATMDRPSVIEWAGTGATHWDQGAK